MGSGAFFLSPKKPDHPILVVPDFDLVLIHWKSDLDQATYGPTTGDAPLRPSRGMGRASISYVPPDLVSGTDWGANARATYEESLIAASKHAMADLGIRGGKVGFDNLLLRTLDGLAGHGGR